VKEDSPKHVAHRPSDVRFQMAILPDLLAPGLNIVFCGTAVSAVSAARGAYYAGPGNAFWPTLYAVGLTPRRFEPEEYPSIIRLGRPRSFA
jgi:TDG/mug DNA glycosylase family protein